MRCRRLLARDLVLVAAGLAVIAVVERGAARESPPVATAAIRNDTVISSVEIDSLPSTRRIEEILIELGKKPVQSSRPGVVPEGWQCKPDGPAWRCSGPAVPAAHLSFEPIEAVRWPSSTLIEARSGGAVVLRSKLPLSVQPVPEVSDTLANTLAVPGRLAAGQPFLVGTLADRFRDGAWRLQVGADWLDPVPPERWGSSFGFQRPDGDRTPGLDARLMFVLPDDATRDTALRFRYDDPWGATLVDAPFADWALEPWPATPCEPELLGCQEKVAVGAPLCVCGCFPALDTYAGLELDGRPLGSPPLAASLFTLSISTADLAPGPHVLAWSAGRGRGRVDFEAVRVAGSIAQDLLQVGQSTDLVFRVEGTRSVLPMDIALKKGGVSLEGGNAQTAYTSGGDANRIERTLYAEGVGDFGIGFTIDLPPCPCSGSGEQSGPGEWALHQLSPNGSGVGVFGELGLRFPIDFSSETVIARSPRPPFETGQQIELDLLQLGLQARSPGLPPIKFESRSEARSFGRLRELRLDQEGSPSGGVLDLDLSTDFTMAFDSKAPLRVGGRYRVGLEELSLEVGFDFGGPGKYRLAPGDGASAGAEFSDVKQDKAGKTLYGSARLQVSGYTFERLRF